MKQLIIFAVILTASFTSFSQDKFRITDFSVSGNKIIEVQTITLEYDTDSLMKAIEVSIQYAEDKKKECTDYHNGVIDDLEARKEEIENLLK